MTIIVLAAGYAVRLQPLTLNTPKPLLTIGGRTIMDRIMDKIEGAGCCGPVYIVSNARFSGKFADWAKASPAKERIKVIDDGTTTNENRLGAIRDLDLVIEGSSINDDVLVVAGDNLFEFDLKKFLDFAKARKDGVSIAAYDIGDNALAKNFGVVKVDEAGKVTDFEEKPPAPKSTLVSTGEYYFPKNKLSFIKEYVKMQDKLDAPGYYIGWLARHDKVYGFRFLEDWFDIGSIESYRKADKKYTKKEK
jgi:glucose-1-phosphate thymidylyltransferase